MSWPPPLFARHFLWVRHKVLCNGDRILHELASVRCDGYSHGELPLDANTGIDTDAGE